MYFAVVALTMFILPVGCTAIAHYLDPARSLVELTGAWFVFWGVGVRLMLAGMRQISQPGFTAQEIFRLNGDEAAPIVRELGFANLATGVAGVLSLKFSTFVVPVAIMGAIFYSAAGFLHLREQRRSGNETLAMVSDFFLALVLAAFLALHGLAA